ncbi:MAG: restriction endonuclease subunit S [Cellvibrio sp.]|nr:restriction endonuclease subunit S [Cellvibrio sp.]
MSEINLPEGWVYSQLGEYLHLKNGYAFKSNSYVAKGDDTVPVIRISDIDGTTATDETAIHVRRADIVDGFEVKKGDLLIAMSGATTGKVGVYIGSEPAYQNQRVGNLKLHSNVFGSAKYKDHLIASLTPEILKIAYGGAQPNISGKAIEEFRVALPPLAEQQQIAQKLDELLAQVDSIKNRLDAIPTILKRFRQSVLAAAVGGRLTEEWRGNCSIDFDSWEKTDLGAVSNIATGKTPKRDQNEYWYNGTIPWLTSSATGNPLTYEAEQFVTDFAVKDCGLKLFDVGTLLLAMYGEGKTRGQVTELKISAACNQACAAITVDESKILRKFVKLVLQENYEETRKVAVGGAQPNLNLNKVREIPVLVPTLEEQTEIVRRVEQLFSYADQIEQRVKDAQARVNYLTQSILAKAFRGELTAEWRAQNPELISGENSAAALLERIRGEREGVKGKVKKAKSS